MTRLRHCDLAAFSRALTTLYAEADTRSLSGRILASLRGLFDCDFASFSLIDLRGARFHAFAVDPLVPGLPGMDVHERHLRSDPAAMYLRRTGKPHAVRMSDFVSLRQYRSLSVYTEVFGRVGCDRRMGFAVKDRSPVSLVSTLNRTGRDFSDEERALLDLLRPHLLQANALAYARDLAAAAARERERERVVLGDGIKTGLAEIGADGRLLWLTPRAEALLGEFFPGQTRGPVSRRLPGAMEKQLAPTLRPAPGLAEDLPGPGRLKWRFPGPGGRALKVRLVPAPGPARWQLLLEETDAPTPVALPAPAAKLTAREREVLAWLKQGKTNWEIGVILGITEKTAGKHLEHIFAKLNVENRTAAAATNPRS